MSKTWLPKRDNCVQSTTVTAGANCHADVKQMRIKMMKRRFGKRLAHLGKLGRRIQQDKFTCPSMGVKDDPAISIWIVQAAEECHQNLQASSACK